MSKIVFSAYFVVFILFFNFLLAQNKKDGDFSGVDRLKVTSPTRNEPKVDSTANHIDTDENVDSLSFSEFYDTLNHGSFTDDLFPSKKPSLLSEDTLSIEEGSKSIVEVSEEVIIDSIWIKIAEYYAIWDNANVNPYEFDGADFKDTLAITLYDTLSEYYASLPLDGEHYVTDNFRRRKYRFHYGTDLRLNIGDTIRAAFDGIVRIKKYNYGGYGNYVMLRHYNGLETIYGHLSEQLVEEFDLVRAGDPIGLGGNTGRSSGPHLHYEVRYRGNAIDPEELYDFSIPALRDNVFVLTPKSFDYIREARRIIYHRIRSGDTLSGIAVRYGTTITRLCRLNGIRRNTILRIGRRLRVR